MEFEALYHADRLRIVNPRGDVGLLTLWSPVRTVERKLAEIDPALLDPGRSRIAVVANLYGDGMYAMLCNLLFNPQVRHLVAIGEDLRLGVPEEIEAFLRDGLEDAEILGRPLKRIPGTQRLLPAVEGFDAGALRRRLTFNHLGKVSSAGLAAALPALLAELPAGAADEPRVRVEIPPASPAEHAPSEVAGHQVVRRRPLDCWEELVVRCARFGHTVQLAKGQRIELQHVKAVVAEPCEDPEDALAGFGFSLDRFRAYQARILDPELPDGIAYTYGNRLRGHFPLGGAGDTDALAAAGRILREDPESRKAYVSLWDTARDLPGDAAPPCLTTVFFRRSEGRLGLSATYRAHNLLTAWLENLYGLMAVQREVAGRAGMEPGPITVISHSLGIDPQSPRYELARSMAERWASDDDLDRETGKRSLREDPNGYFQVSVDRDRGCLIAEHRYRGVLVKRYEGRRAEAIEREVAADMAVSLVSHALWLGRELARKEQSLRGA